MKRTTIQRLDQTQIDCLDVSFDVSKAKLDFYVELPRQNAVEVWEGQVANREEELENELNALITEARQAGFSGLRVLCGPTGIYHRRLLRVARKLGCLTALVSGEAVNKSQVIQSNDTNKTDKKDPRTILMVARNGKTLTDRQLSGGWLTLRQLNLHYDRLERESTRIKNTLHRGLFELFCDLSFKPQWIFESQAAEHLAELYGFNPYRIVQEGHTRLRDKLRRRKVRATTIERIWNDAQQSILMQQDPALVQWLEEEVREQHRRLRDFLRRRQQLRQRMVAELVELHQAGETRIDPHNAPVGPFMLARVLAETGPLSDFGHFRQLLRYAGLNLRQKQSGTFKGKDKLSKKGRARLRHCALQACVKLVVRGQLYADYFHRKRAEGMSGNKAMTTVARKLLRLLHGLEKAGGAYQPQRVFDQTQATMQKAA